MTHENQVRLYNGQIFNKIEPLHNIGTIGLYEINNILFDLCDIVNMAKYDLGDIQDLPFPIKWIDDRATYLIDSSCHLYITHHGECEVYP